MSFGAAARWRVGRCTTFLQAREGRWMGWQVDGLEGRRHSAPAQPSHCSVHTHSVRLQTRGWSHAPTRCWGLLGWLVGSTYDSVRSSARAFCWLLVLSNYIFCDSVEKTRCAQPLYSSRRALTSKVRWQMLQTQYLTHDDTLLCF